MPRYEDLTGGQKELYDKLKTRIQERKSINDLYEDFPEKEDWQQVLTTVACLGHIDDQKRTLTLLGYAIYTNDQESIRAILDVAKKDKEVLKEVLTTPNIKIKFSDGKERTLTPLGCAIDTKNQESIRAILDVAEKEEVLKEVFAGIEEHGRKRLKEILETLKIQEQNEEQKTKIGGWLEILAKSVSSSYKSDSDQKDTVKTTNKSIMIGSVCGVIAALAVGIGCGIAGVALPILALIGIAVAAALVIGVIAGITTYSVSKPSDKLDQPDLEGDAKLIA